METAFNRFESTSQNLAQTPLAGRDSLKFWKNYLPLFLDTKLGLGQMSPVDPTEEEIVSHKRSNAMASYDLQETLIICTKGRGTLLNARNRKVKDRQSKAEAH